MNITHHPSDELMLDYASGALSEGWALAVATHLSMCDSSSGLLRGMETIGGILLDEADEACISDKMFGSVLDKIDSDMISSVGQKEPVKGRKFSSVVPKPLATYVGNDLEALARKNLGWGTSSPNRIK